MKTKNLFLATALVASLAACTNEEIVDMQQQNIANGRPTVDNVTLNFGMGADSRVIYDGGWKWNSTDVIGALLMDNVNYNPASGKGWEDEDATWAEKYNLVPFIHTSYPFTYSDGAWSCNTKMLEGNYFFAHPWASYDGVRKVSHSLLAQKQTGIEKEVRGKAYAENNLFIGYQRIVAGTQAQDVLEDVNMYPVLGAIQLQIKNTGTQDRHINKVVLSGTGLYSTLTFDPTQALDPRDADATGAPFMSAEYLNIEEEIADEDFKSWNAKEKEAHILSVVAQGEVADGQNEGFVQVTIEGTEAERLLKAGAKNTAYVMVMANPVADVTDLKLAIYTDEGVVTNIDLTTENDEIDVDSEGKGTTAITSAVVEAIGPNTTNTIEVQIDDNSFTIPRSMDIYTSEDLMQLIQWNANAVGKRTVTANLKKNVTLTEEATEILATAKLITLNITGTDAELTIAEEVPATFFDEKLNKNGDRVNAALGISVKTIIEGTINVDENTAYLPADLVIAEGAALNINVDYKTAAEIENNGTLNIADEVSVKNAEIANNGLMIVGEDADVKAEVINGGADVEAELRNNGYMTDVDNKAGSVVKMGQGASLVGGANAGLIVSAKDAIIDIEGENGYVEYKSGASIITDGVVYQKITTATTLVDDEDEESPVNALLIEGCTVTINDKVDDFSTIILGEAAKIEVKKGKELIVANLETIEVEEEDAYKAYIQGEGTVTVDNVTVYEFTTLTNTGNIHVNESFDNDGTVNNKGAVEVPADAVADLNATDWNYTVATGWNASVDVTAEEKALNEALIVAINDWMATDYYVKDFKFDLKNTTLKSKVLNVEYTGAANTFAAWVNGSATHTPCANLIAALNAYNAKATTDKTLTSNYNTAVTKILARYKGAESIDDKTAKEDKMSALANSLEWTAPATLAEGMARIYKDGQEMNADNTALVDVTAETLATRAFIKAVQGGVITKGSALTSTEKCMLVTNGENKAPAGSQVFVTDNIYKVFNKTNGIGQLTDWTGVISGLMCNTVFATEADLLSSGWTAAIVKNWVEKVAVYQVVSGTPEIIEASKAKAFVTANTYEIYEEAKTWNCYSPNVVMAIVADYNGWTLVNGTVTLP